MKFKFIPMLGLALCLGFVSCNNEDDTLTPPKETTTSTYSILGTVDKTSYLLQIEDLKKGTLSFKGKGEKIDADQAARIISQNEYVYSLNYGTGLISQFITNKDGSFKKIKEINAGLAVGTNTPRFKKADKNTIMVYNVVVTPTFNNANEVIDNTSTLRLASINIPSLTVGNLTEFVIPQTTNAQKGGTIGYEPMRVDAPVISGNKIYFGLMHLDYSNPQTPPPFRQPKQTGLETLVFDYPAFTNGKIVASNAAAGHTSGYRAPSMHVDEKGDVYQSNWFMSGNRFDLSNGDKTVITRLKDGTYDSSYVFNISEALGLDTNIATVGWFYVGNGIGYMPIQLEDKGNYYTQNSWGLAKIDLYNKTAIKLNTPDANLFSYENGVIANGKFYMAITAIGGEGAIYELDPTKDTAVKTVTLSENGVQVSGIY